MFLSAVVVRVHGFVEHSPTSEARPAVCLSIKYFPCSIYIRGVFSFEPSLPTLYFSLSLQSIRMGAYTYSSASLALAVIFSVVSFGACGGVPLPRVLAFQDPPNTPPGAVRWPELDLPDVAAKPPYGMVFSGGGSRAYVAAVGVLGGLTELGLIERIRYVGGASGGGWATAAYSYFQPSQLNFQTGEQGAANDEELLGNITFPMDITPDSLEQMSPNCLRGSMNHDVVKDFLSSYLHNGFHFHKAFIDGIHKIYLARANIPKPYGSPPKLFSYDSDTIADIKARNPALTNDFIVPAPGRPFMLLGFTLLGPTELVPLDKSNRTYTVLESNPLYTGRPDTSVYTYQSASKKKPAQPKIVGGAIETFAFGASSPSVRLLPNETVGTLPSMTLPGEPFTLAHAAATGGWAAADEIAAQLGKLAPIAEDLFGLDRLYFSSATPPTGANPQPSDDFSLGDSGITENLHLINMLRREDLEGILVFTNSNQFVNPVKKWDPTKRPPTPGDLDDTIPNYFGIDPDKPAAAWDYSRNHVFETSQFVPFAQKLQAAVEKGDGPIVQMTLNVVDNAFWGIRGGRSIKVTWVYLCRTFGWEDQLPQFLKDEMVPKERDPSVLPGKDSKFPLFPHYPTMQLQLSAAETNLLADMMGWIIIKNQDLFCPFLGIHGGCPRR